MMREIPWMIRHQIQLSPDVSLANEIRELYRASHLAERIVRRRKVACADEPVAVVCGARLVEPAICDWIGLAKHGRSTMRFKPHNFVAQICRNDTAACHHCRQVFDITAKHHCVKIFSVHATASIVGHKNLVY